MKVCHIALAALVAVIWGLAYVATKIALDGFSPPQLTALRFLISAKVIGERFGLLRLAEMTAIIIGLAIVLLPIERTANFCLVRFRVQDE